MTRDVLATIVWILRNRDVAAWNAMSNAQKRTAILTEIAEWEAIRDYLEGKL